MTVATLIKRTIVVIIGLAIVVAAALTALYHYIDRSPAAQERLELSAKSIEGEVEDDTPVLTTISLLIAAWWESDKLVEEAKRDKAETARYQADRKREEEARRFNDSQYDSGSDYYPNGN
ncbi:MAG: hypothetical protein ACKOPM_12840 [Novosphingobium sp.]